MIPFLILYAGLIIECLAILVFILVGDTSLKSHVSQSYSMQKKYFIASSCLNIFTPSFQKLFLRKAMSPLVDCSFVLFLDFIESFTLSQPIIFRCKFHWEEEGSLSRGAPCSLLPPLVFRKRDLQKHGETDQHSFCKIFVSLQMVEKSRQSPESRDIFELQYQTNCSVNVSYNFTNSDLQDGDNKVWTCELKIKSKLRAGFVMKIYTFWNIPFLKSFWFCR